MNRVYPIFFLVFALWFAACEREDISTNPSLRLNFSTDTVMFDTVFTSIGSSTQHFKVYNRNSYDLKISSIKLVGGGTSNFKINVDGAASATVEDITIRRNDSLYIFVQVTVDPNNQSSPLVVADSIVFETNGNAQDVKLIAWGQDVHLIKTETIESNTTYVADKPYLIYDYLLVNPNILLNIEAGAKLYFHNNAYLVVQGTLQVNGEFENPITFEGDRRELFYRDKAGQWGGIWLYAGSKNNSIEWAEIRGSINGIIVDTCVTVGTPTLRISNTKIENVSSIGLYARGSKIDADNCLFSNAGQVSVALTMGGVYQFYHCTIANYWGQYIYRNGPALMLNNYYLYSKVENGSLFVEPRDLEQASFNNCIVYGSRDKELEIDNTYKGEAVSAAMNYNFDHCILKMPNDFNTSDPTKFVSVSKEDPKFKDPWKLNYQLDTLSPAKDGGKVDFATLFPIDLKNISHLLDLFPDLGAYERKE
ncbi:MAG: hypothetical protein EHM93_11980 [Bacteroidales bacterium]|nr:MAG: hypothetical protein EHM93_11980 [Bacteroidales bacterium]